MVREELSQLRQGKPHTKLGWFCPSSTFPSLRDDSNTTIVVESKVLGLVVLSVTITLVLEIAEKRKLLAVVMVGVAQLSRQVAVVLVKELAGRMVSEVALGVLRVRLKV